MFHIDDDFKSKSELKGELDALTNTMRKTQTRMVSRNLLKKNVTKDPVSKPKKDDDDMSMHGLAMRIPAEIIAGSIVGYFIGVGLDKLLETEKVFTIICLLLGNLGAFLNIIRNISSK